MNKTISKIAASAALALVSFSASASLTPSYDAFGQLNANFGGTGIPNHAVASETFSSRFGGTVTLGLTSTARYANAAVTNDGQGRFYAKAGVDQTDVGSMLDLLARWNVNYYIDGSNALSALGYSYRLLLDIDPTTGENFKTKGLFTGEQQDSWNIGSWTSELASGYSFDPTQAGEYSFRLEAVRSGQVAAFTSIVVNVSAVPEPASLALVGVGLLGMAAAARRRKA